MKMPNCFNSLWVACFCALLFASCTKSVSLRVLQPAEMKMPDHLTKIAIVDRSKPSKGWLNVLEGVLTGEEIGQDRRSREEAVSGLTHSLQRTPRFSVIRTGIEMTGSKAGNNLPTPLDWAEVQKICGDYGADAVVCIESFDSDNVTNTRRNESKSKDKKGNQIVTVTFESLMRTSVRMGWRMYDPKTKIILDEFTTEDYLERTGSGRTEQAALNNLPDRTSVTRSVAHLAGQHYGMRIAPVYVNINRDYYGKAKGVKAEMKRAARLADSSDWDEAVEVWKKVLMRPDVSQKSKGKAAYNIAVAAEIKGDLDLALERAEKAYRDYGSKKARNYIDILKMRQNDARKVEYQMNKKV